jgi:hypothetical protein
MSRDLTPRRTGALANPLQSIIDQAAAKPALPRVEAYARRLNASGPTVLLLDVSGSMAAAAWGGRRKIDILRDAVRDLMSTDAPRLVTFAATAAALPADAASTAIPEPAGGTALHRGIDAVSDLRPARTLVISDGQPDDEGRALAAAALLTGTIDVLYVGPDSDAAAIAFMARLARSGSGTMHKHDLMRSGSAALASVARRIMIAGPK